jgi:hypothetical protein
MVSLIVYLDLFGEISEHLLTYFKEQLYLYQQIEVSFQHNIKFGYGKGSCFSIGFDAFNTFIYGSDRGAKDPILEPFNNPQAVGVCALFPTKNAIMVYQVDFYLSRSMKDHS